MIKPNAMGVPENETFVVPVEEGDPLLVMVWLGTAKKIRKIAARKNITPAQLLAGWIEQHNIRPLSEDELKDLMPNIHRRVANYYGPLSLAFCIALLLASIYNFVISN